MAKEVGVSERTLKRWSAADGGWRRLTGPEITASAHQVANQVRRTVGELGPEVSTNQQQIAIDKLAEDAAIDLRADVLARHRKEWSAARAISVDAVRLRDSDPEKAFERAKLAKITAETLAIVQNGERRAWGLDVNEVPAATVVVIERY
ncbi:hypothetical protein E8F11_22000 [Pseudomonas sp. BN417]|uniref:hypothetical protein n=1 Tax=Pseudomonas sp. BN417 TaxID=2567890 RepID=UPI00245582E4|nr:hypothetical protein [Pseudomonas sp. BN417]MDH4557810.1 hypothetical protein [Pseudomonas sp. BN417]